jgi:8-oxo-dGTP pyrophosphatase MutT (NUDIX family)
MDIPEFGLKRENEERRDGGLAIVFDPQTQKYAVGIQHESGSYRLFSGGVDEGEDIVAGTIREVTEESGLYDFEHVENIGQAITHYYNSLRKVNRVAHATCLLIVLKSTDLKPVHLEEHEKFSLTWVTEGELRENWEARNANKDLDHWIYFLDKGVLRLKKLGFIK